MSRRRMLTLGAGAVALAAGCSDDAAGGDSEAVRATLDPPSSSGPGTDPTTTITAPRSTQSSAPTPVPDPTTLTGAEFSDVGACTLTPGQTSGPFYLRADLVRRDITEGLPGSPLRVGLRVENDECEPVEDARVDIWHADLDGDYSAFVDGSADDEEGEGTTFLRGTQITGPDGIVEFRTIFPGWYPQRALHIHVMVYLGRDRVLTSQMYFSNDVIADVFRSAPYLDRGLPDLPTSRDRIAGDPVALGLEMAVTGDDAGRLALLRLHVPT